MPPHDARTYSREVARPAPDVPEPADWVVSSPSPMATDRLGRRIGRALRGGEILTLCGELGSGKTALVRGVAAGLGAEPRSVSSPTFVLIQEYAGRLRLVHADLYRIDAPAELHDLGLGEEMDRRTVLVVEWAEKAAGELGSDRLDVRLHHRGARSRELRFRGIGPRARGLLARVRRAARARPRPAGARGRKPRP